MKYLYCSLILAASALAASQSDPMSLSDTLRLAQDRSPVLQMAKADVSAARARSGMRQAPFKPLLSLNGVASTGDGSMIFPTAIMPYNYLQTQPGTQASGNVTLMWRVWSFGRDALARRGSEAEIHLYEARSELAGSDVSLGVRDAFAIVIFRRDVLFAKQEALMTAREMLRITVAKFDEGSAPKAFVFRAQADVSSMERELVMAQADIDEALAMLRERVGLDQVDPMQFGSWDESLVAPESLKAAIKIALDSHPEVRIARWNLESARLASRDASKSRLPELSFMAMGDWMGSRMMPGSATSKAGLVLSFPLSDGGERGSLKGEADAMIVKMEQEFRMAELQVQSAVAAAYASWSSVETQRRATQDGLTASLEAFRVMQERYDAGKAVLVELIDARAQVAYARTEVADVERYARSAWARLMRAIGKA